MTKFNVGDSIEFIEKYGSYEVGDKVTLTAYRDDTLVGFEGKYGNGCALETRFKLSDKPTKNQRITTLENEVAELKLIVHELRERPQLTTVINNSIQEPSTTNTVEDIIEFEGQQYRKVDREAHEGDVVIFTVSNVHYRSKKSYKVIENVKFTDENGQVIHVYNEHKRTPETVDVYELIKPKPLTPNQQRAEIIEKAKKFVEGNLKLLVSYDFVVINNGTKLYSRQLFQDIKLTTAKCSPNNVFNEHIGKAITLGRALGLDVSEFEQAVQPTKAVNGQLLTFNSGILSTIYEVINVNSNDSLKIIHDDNCKNVGKTAFGDFSENLSPLKIINDTNAKY